ncbi:hypothetical protein HDU99_010746 [Rhizoclosmatium hyalinum]|nr:hypothetical protein HDU99_010746 [Rhizoclosmatium hyalinum]
MFGLVQRFPRTQRQWRNASDPGLVEDHLKTWIDKTIKETGKKPTVLMSGMGTDVALLFRKYPDYAKKVERLVWMGGAVDVPGNLFSVPSNTKAEFNMYLDCVAGQEIFANPNVSVTLVPLDFTNQIVLDKSLFEALAKKWSFAGKFVHDLLQLQATATTSYGSYETFFQQNSLWDPQALGVLQNIGVTSFETNIRIRQQCGSFPDPNTDGALFRLPSNAVGANVTIAKKAAVSAQAAQNPILAALINAL